MVSDVAALAMVLMKLPDSSAWPTSSGHVYVSSGAMLRVSMIRFDAPGLPPLVTKLTLMVTLPALVLVIVNLSMIALQFTAVYCVVWAFSACFGGIKTLIDTVISFSLCGFATAGDDGEACGCGLNLNSVTCVQHLDAVVLQSVIAWNWHIV